MENNTKLTPDQEKAAELIRIFLEESNTKVFTLKGCAGTGKTFLVNSVLQPYSEAGKKIAVCAFTNKATNVIGRKTPFAKAVTLFRMLGLRTNEDSAELKFDAKGKNQVKDFDIIVLDEVSMVGDEYYKHLLESAKKCGTKILCMGDPVQLPPVGQETDSLAFGVKNGFELTEIVRQSKDSDIPLYCQEIRDFVGRIENGENVPITTKIKYTPVKGDIAFTKEMSLFFSEALKDFKSDEYTFDKEYCKVIAYRNNTLDKMNAIIRKSIFGEDVDSLVVGDVLMLNASVSDDSKPPKNIFDNSDEVEIMDIFEKTNYEKEHNGVDICFDYYDVLVRRVWDDLEYEMRFVDPSQKQKFAKKMSEWGNTISKLKNSGLIFKTEFYPFQKEYASPSYAFAISSHRSQGSTIKNVYVLANDIESVSLATQKNLWNSKYVAFTRASEKLLILESK